MNVLNRTPGTPGTSGTLRTGNDAARGSVVPGVPKVPEVRFHPFSGVLVAAVCAGTHERAEPNPRHPWHLRHPQNQK